MLPYIVAGLIGAFAANSRMPNTKVNKLKCIGPKSGLTYNVEEFVGTGFIVVRYQSESGGATLQKNRHAPGYIIITVVPGTSPHLIERIKADFTNVKT